MRQFLDQYGFVKPRRSGEFGNPVIYSVIADILGLGQFSFDSVRHQNGTLMRTPVNAMGNQSHDCYTAFAIHCLMNRETWLPRSILLTTILKLGYMKNCPYHFTESWTHNVKQILRPFILIYPAWWVITIASAFPNRVVFWITRNLLTVLIRLQKLNLSDASGIQLRWLLCHAVRLMGSDAPMTWLMWRLRTHGTTLSNVMKAYWDEGHPVLDGYKRYEENF